MKKRHIDILDKVLVSEFPIKINHLSKGFNVSERTIRNDIDAINILLLESNYPTIKNIRSQGYQLTVDNAQKEKIRDLFSQNAEKDFFTREDRILDLLLDISFGKAAVFLNRKEKEYDVSKSTLDEDMRILRKRLLPFSIDIVSLSKLGLVFKGTEASIRALLYTALSMEFEANNIEIKSKGHHIINNYISQADIEFLDCCFSDCISSTDEGIYRLSFIILTCIWKERLKRACFLSDTETEVFNAKGSSNGLDLFIGTICSHFELSPSVAEVNYIHLMLESFKVNGASKPINWVQLQIFIINLINFVEKTTGIPFNKKDNLLQEGLYKHLVSMVVRIQNDVQLVNPLKERIKESYGSIYRAVLNYSAYLEEHLNKKISEDEIAFLTIHFSTILSELNQEKDYCFRAAVICNQGLATGKLLSENLKEFFDIEVIAILSTRELSIIDKLDVDLVFSTVDITSKSKPVLVLNPIIQEETKLKINRFLEQNKILRRTVTTKVDFTQLFLLVLQEIEGSGLTVKKQLYQNLEKLFEQYKLPINKREVQPMLQDVLFDKHILITDKEFGWKEAIRYVSEPLLDDNIITENYVEAMLKSVTDYGPYIVIGPHLALAHARPEEGSNELGLSVSVFKKSVSFGESDEQQVKVIFCLSAVDSFSHLQIMKSIVDLIKNTDKVERLSQAEDVNTIKNILFHSDKEEE